MSTALKLIHESPETELQIELDRVLKPKLILKLASKNNIELPYKNVREVYKAYNYKNLQEFLDIYFYSMCVLLTEDDFYNLTMAYLKDCDSSNVRYIKIFLNPQTHTERGISFSAIIMGVVRALNEGQVKFGISSKLILSFLRHLSEGAAFVTLEEAKPYLHSIYGVALDSSGIGHPPSKFIRVLKVAATMGLIQVENYGERYTSFL